MQQPIFDIAKRDLFTPKEELVQRPGITPAQVEHVIRLRDMYTFVLDNPGFRAKDFLARFSGQYGIGNSRLYADLALTKQLVSTLTSSSRDFYRQQVNDMLLETYRMAKLRKDVKTMERCAASLGKLNRIDIEDEQQMPFDKIVPQSFQPVNDPSVIGIKKHYSEEEKARLLREFGVDFPDVEDVTYEEVETDESLFKEDTADGEE